jgi:hypothetical protein
MQTKGGVQSVIIVSRLHGMVSRMRKRIRSRLPEDSGERRMSQPSSRRRFYLMSVEEAQMWVNFMGRREAERYYPGILELLRAAGEVNARRIDQL